ncbi:hypothetical protein EXN66_Car019539 [Channa argus]|uniref:Uncharacterized protein n=1 Tax=Channa argus TaxID=215402 RepID=A0A6G1QMF6_CHAAH|nr:hypothetical protein EXN66_Car019539 [Channa argus]
MRRVGKTHVVITKVKQSVNSNTLGGKYYLNSAREAREVTQEVTQEVRGGRHEQTKHADNRKNLNTVLNKKANISGKVQKHRISSGMFSEEEGHMSWQQTVGGAGYKYKGPEVKTIRVQKKQEAKETNWEVV